MNDTPRTEVNRLSWKRHEEDGVSAEFARGLERELNEANERIKRLIEAGDMIENDLKLHWSETRSMNAWNETKESK